MGMAPTRRSVTAMLDKRTFESFCSCLFRFTAMIINTFKMMVRGELMAMRETRIQGRMVLFVSHVKSGACGQENTDLVSEEMLTLVFVMLKSMLI